MDKLKEKLKDRLKKKPYAAVAVFTAVILTVAASAMSGGPRGGMGNMGQGKMSESKITVKLVNPEKGEIELTTDYIGRVQPQDTIKVYTEVQGKVAATYVEEGQTVHKGQLLFEMDTEDMEIALEKAQAQYDHSVAQNAQTLGSSLKKNLLNAENSYNNSKNSFKTARDNLDELEDKLDDYRANYREAKAELDAFTGNKDSDDYKELLEAANDAKADYDRFKDTYDEQYSNCENSKDNAYDSFQYSTESYELTAGQMREETEAIAEANMRTAKLNYETAVRNLEKCKIYAPVDGVIETKSVSASDMVGTSTVCYTITNVNAMEVAFNVSAGGAMSLSIGDNITLSKSGQNMQAAITSVSSSADTSSGLFPVKAALSSDAIGMLSGVAVKVTATTAKEQDVLLVPNNCVYYEENKPYVYLFDEETSTAKKTFFTAGLYNADSVSVKEGLSEGDRIITTWHPDLKDGAKVNFVGGEVKAAETPADNAAKAEE